MERPRQTVAVGVTPGELTLHRDSISTADVGTPVYTAFWANPGFQKVGRVVASIDFTGGTTPTCTLTVWLKPMDAQTPIVQWQILEWDGSSDLLEGDYVWDLDVNGWDVFVNIDNVLGSPTSFDVDVWVAGI